MEFLCIPSTFQNIGSINDEEYYMVLVDIFLLLLVLLTLFSGGEGAKLS